MEAKQLLEKLIDGQNLDHQQAVAMMEGFMDGVFTPAQTASILTALRIKSETVEEITACAQVMRAKSTKIPIQMESLIDTCGTGGDGSGSFNISTTVALLLASGGYKIAKHGNRSMTSKSGSADLLEALGVNLSLTPEQVAACIEQVGIGFLFAPALHSAMKNVVPIRQEIAIRTVFNLLGPLTNPAGAKVQIIGLYASDLVPKIIRVLKKLGASSAYVFSGNSGLDEVCIAGNTRAARLCPNGTIQEFDFNPEEYGFPLAGLDEIKGGTPEENAEITQAILSGQSAGPKCDIVILNAGFAISAIEDIALESAFEKARSLISQGRGIDLIEKLSNYSNSLH